MIEKELKYPGQDRLIVLRRLVNAIQGQGLHIYLNLPSEVFREQYGWITDDLRDVVIYWQFDHLTQGIEFTSEVESSACGRGWELFNSMSEDGLYKFDIDFHKAIQQLRVAHRSPEWCGNAAYKNLTLDEVLNGTFKHKVLELNNTEQVYEVLSTLYKPVEK